MTGGEIASIISFLAVALVIAAVIFALRHNEPRKDPFRDYQKIEHGMTKDKVIDLLGDSYTKSLLKDGRERLEWTWRERGYSMRLGNGLYTHSSGVTSHVTVTFKDGVVIEMTAKNMD